MINYYEVLEVSEKASEEIIEKAYKVLAKKYHPDLQQNGNKKAAEEKMKLVNEAYDVLSNQGKREAYDKKLNDQRTIENVKKQQQVNTNTNINNRNYTNPNINHVKPNYNQTRENVNNEYRNQRQNYTQEELKKQDEFRKSVEKEARRRYLEAYDNYLRSLGYRVKYRWTWDRVRALLITIGVMILIGILLWIIPPSRMYLIKLYEENFLIKLMVDIIRNILTSFVDVFKKG